MNAFIQGCWLHFTGTLTSARLKDCMMGSALGGCDTFHSRLVLGMGWMLWVVLSLVTTLSICLARIPSTCGLYWQPSWSIVTESAGTAKVLPSRPDFT